MKKCLALFSALIVLAACKGKEETEAPKDEQQKPKEKLCYALESKGDTIRLSLIQNANNVTGELLYSLKEKDRNEGTVSGIFVGDTLYADYTFRSEGTTSVREIIFVKRGSEIVEGTGPMEEKADKQTFIMPRKLSFTGVRLQSTDCN
ncbi:MAG: hypothetical protein EOO51_11335 [Flavobacterium sp.]|nr:MAG: hypothetical protein EOO51_11335 [Flavobacterium sp.]